MDSRRLDQITRTFASGMTRRGAMKGVAAALGLSVVGALRSSTEAAPTNTFGRGAYYCSEADRYVYRCAILGDSLPDTARYRGESAVSRGAIAAMRQEDLSRQVGIGRHARTHCSYWIDAGRGEQLFLRHLLLPPRPRQHHRRFQLSGMSSRRPLSR